MTDQPSRLATIRVKSLRLRTYVGFNGDEQQKRQDVVINMALDYDAGTASQRDAVEEALDYKAITKRIIALVEGNRFLLLEKMVGDIIDLALEYEAVRRVSVEVDKPHALRFADSVSLSAEVRRDG